MARDHHQPLAVTPGSRDDRAARKDEVGLGEQRETGAGEPGIDAED
jgi:hypothetical protein